MPRYSAWEVFKALNRPYWPSWIVLALGVVAIEGVAILGDHTFVSILPVLVGWLAISGVVTAFYLVRFATVKGLRRFGMAAWSRNRGWKRASFMLFIVLVAVTGFAWSPLYLALGPSGFTVLFMPLGILIGLGRRAFVPFAFRPVYEQYTKNVLVRASRQVPGLEDGYSPRPYSQVAFSPAEAGRFFPQLGGFADFAVQQLGIAAYKPGSGEMVFYLPTLEVYRLIGYRGKNVAQHVTRVTAYADGTLAVYVSPEEYRRLGREVTYHQLCQALLGAFTESIRAYMNGNPAGAAWALAPHAQMATAAA